MLKGKDGVEVDGVSSMGRGVVKAVLRGAGFFFFAGDSSALVAFFVFVVVFVAVVVMSTTGDRTSATDLFVNPDGLSKPRLSKSDLDSPIGITGGGAQRCRFGVWN